MRISGTMILRNCVSVLQLLAAYISVTAGENVWDLRLIHGAHIYEGEVEVYLGSRGWFPTCDPTWGMEEAIVVCRQMGYPGAAMAIPNMSTRSIIPLARQWRCTGDELTLADCLYSPTNLCMDLAGVICQEPGYLGCYQDTYGALTSTLVDSTVVEPDMTVDRCRSVCMQYHYRIVGLKNGNECYCGISDTELIYHAKLSDAECQMPCPGNNRQVCGGQRVAGTMDRLSVFDVNLGSCVHPGVPDNGFPLDFSYNFGDIVRFDCNPGYQLIGVSAVQCILAPAASGLGVMWSTTIPSCFRLPTTEMPSTTTERTTTTPMPTTTMKTTTKMMTTTAKAPTPMKTEPPTERKTTERTTTRMPVTRERPAPTERMTERMTEKMTSSARTRMTTTTTKMNSKMMTTEDVGRPVTSESEATTKKTPRPQSEKMLTAEMIDDVTNYTNFITEPKTETSGNGTENEASTGKWNLFNLLSEHSILIALGGMVLILIVPIIIIVIVKKGCRRRSPKTGDVHIERTLDYVQMGTETSGYTYEPQPEPRPRYQSFRRGFKRFSKRPWSDREEDTTDDEL